MHPRARPPHGLEVQRVRIAVAHGCDMHAAACEAYEVDHAFANFVFVRKPKSVVRFESLEAGSEGRAGVAGLCVEPGEVEVTNLRRHARVIHLDHFRAETGRFLEHRTRRHVVIRGHRIFGRAIRARHGIRVEVSELLHAR